MEEERAGADAAREPLSLRQADNERAEDVLELFITQVVANVGQRFRGLLTNNRLVRLGKSLQKRQELSFVRVIELPNFSELLSDGKEYFVVLVLDQG